MERGCRAGALFLLGCFIVLWSIESADASIELHVDGRVISSRPALALLGTGLGLALPALENEFGFAIDDRDFPVVSIQYGERAAILVVDDRRAIVDGQRVQLQVPPRMQDGTVFVPLRLVADMADLRVDWDILSGTLNLDQRSGVAVVDTSMPSPSTPPRSTTSGSEPSGSPLSGTTPSPSTPSGTASSGTTPSPSTLSGSSRSPSTSTEAMTPRQAPTPDDPPALDESARSVASSVASHSSEFGVGDFESDNAATGKTERGAFEFTEAGNAAILHDVRIGVVNGRVQLEVVADEPVDASVMFMPNPARLVVDVPDAVLGIGWRSTSGDGAIVEQVRAAATQDGGVRLVADLTGPTGYKLHYAEDQRAFTVQLNHQLQLLSADPTGTGGLALHMQATGPVGYSVFPLRAPARLVIDVSGATIPGAQEIELTGQFASSVRLSQYEHDIVRVVVELRGSGTAALFSSRLAQGMEGDVHPDKDGSFVLTVHPLTGFAVERQLDEPDLGMIQYVGLMEHDGTEFVFIEADTPLRPELRRFREPERLVLDFQGMQLERSLGLTAGLVEPGVVGTVRAGQAEPAVSRIVVETSGIVEQHLFTSPDGKRAVLAVRPSHLGGRTIVVDPGHGGRDPGAIGFSGTYEKHVTLAIALRAARLLEQSGATVILTRDNDVTLELAERSALANAVAADAFVSIHADAIGFGRRASGTSTFYYPENGHGPEASVNHRYARALQTEMLGAVGLHDRGVHQRAFHVVLNTDMPSALVEVGFIDNPDEEKLLIEPEFQERAAAGIVHGILRFFGEEQQLDVPDSRQQWMLASEQAVSSFLQNGTVPGDAVALVPTAVLGSLPEASPSDAGF